MRVVDVSRASVEDEFLYEGLEPRVRAAVDRLWADRAQELENRLERELRDDLQEGIAEEVRDELRRVEERGYLRGLEEGRLQGDAVGFARGLERGRQGWVGVAAVDACPRCGSDVGACFNCAGAAEWRPQGGEK
jgi:hypothetical protein